MGDPFPAPAPRSGGDPPIDSVAGPSQPGSTALEIRRGEMNTDGIVNALLDSFVPRLNEALPGAVRDAGLDPWKKVASGKENFGKVDLGLCKARAKAKYAIEKMKGLGSIEILTLDLESAATILSGDQASGRVWMKARLNQKLTARVEGSISASCGAAKVKEKISGKVTVKGVGARVKVSYEATLGSPKSCLNSMDVDALSLDYDSIDVDIDGIGIFNDFLDPLEHAVTGLFEGAIRDEIAGALRPVLDDLVEDEVPFCVGVADVATGGVVAESA